MKPQIIKHARAIRDLEDRSDFIREHNPDKPGVRLAPITPALTLGKPLSQPL